MSPAKEKRGSQRVKVTDAERQDSPMTKKHVQCCHQLQDLQLATDLYWCEPDRKDKTGLFSWTWLQHVKGCVGCNKMFVQVTAKEKRQYHDTKIATLPRIAPEIITLWDRLDNGLLLSDKFEQELKEAEAEKANGPIKDRLIE